MKIKEKILSFTGSNNFFPVLLALAAFSAFAPSLGTRDFFYDDQPLVLANPVLHQGWQAFPKLFSKGYWEMVKGKNASVEEYRPLLMATFFLETRLFGDWLFEMHALNLLLHFLACWLIYVLLKRRLGRGAAQAAALLFAVLAVHLESVALLVGRSEMLSAVLILGAWICLDFSESPRVWAGALFYAAALLTKESAIMFLPLIFLDDWVFSKTPENLKKRKTLYSTLILISAAYLLLRVAVLRSPFLGGPAYFRSGRLIQSLTMGLFFWKHYFLPSVSGLGICSDFSKPLIADASIFSPLAWLSFLALALSLGVALYFLFSKRAAWAFWVLFPFLFLLPTSNFIIALDTIGAQRFLYLPSLALCVGFGFSWMRFLSRKSWGRLAAVFFVLWQVSLAFSRSSAWTTPIGFYWAAAACNPVSASAQYSLGVRFFRAGRDQEGLKHMEAALKLNPRYADIWYDLAHFAWDQKDSFRARFFLKKAIRLNSSDADSRVLLSEVEESAGQIPQAKKDLEAALRINPDNASAQYDFGILLLKSGDIKRGRSHLRQFLKIAPESALAPRVAKALSKIK